jgi:glycerol uptake operon antiterminator
MQHAWLSQLRNHPIIAAIRDPADVGLALESPINTVFLLSGHLLNIVEMIRRAAREERFVFVHLDLIDGLAKDQHGVRWLAEAGRPTGVITTRASMVSAARVLGLATIQRVFLLDSQSIHTGLEVAHNTRADVLELLPGILPEVIRELLPRANRPLIAGGLIKTPEQCRGALAAGAWAISTSDHRLWRLDPRELLHNVPTTTYSEVNNP